MDVFSLLRFSHSATETMFDGPKSWKIVGKGITEMWGKFHDDLNGFIISGSKMARVRLCFGYNIFCYTPPPKKKLNHQRPKKWRRFEAMKPEVFIFPIAPIICGKTLEVDPPFKKCHLQNFRYLRWRVSWTLVAGYFGGGELPLHKPYPYSLYRWGIPLPKNLKCLVKMVKLLLDDDKAFTQDKEEAVLLWVFPKNRGTGVSPPNHQFV